jgi:hypothetical protein
MDRKLKSGGLLDREGGALDPFQDRLASLFSKSIRTSDFQNRPLREIFFIEYSLKRG